MVVDSINRKHHASERHRVSHPALISWTILGLPDDWNVYRCGECNFPFATRTQRNAHGKGYCPKQRIKGNTPYVKKASRTAPKWSEINKKAIYGEGKQRGNNPRIGS